jgi:hypothetical protein
MNSKRPDIHELFLDCKRDVSRLVSVFTEGRPIHEYTTLLKQVEAKLFMIHEDYQRLIQENKSLKRRVNQLDRH